MDLFRLSLHDAAERIREGSLTSESYAASLLGRIRALEPQVRAWSWLDEAALLAAARAADGLRASGAPLGALHGVPVGIKDIVHVAGMPCAMGSPLFAGFVPVESAAVVRRLEAAGALMTGKTVTAELAYFQPGPTRNPWNLRHTPGGSSMGSAAAVACGMVPVALGTQTNGSVIRPAAFCGCVGYLPSRGRTPAAGILRFAPSLDQAGVFARNVSDAARMAAVLAGDSVTGDTMAAAEIRPPRLCAVRSPVWDLTDEVQRRCFAHNLDALCAAGAIVEERELPPAFNAAHAVHRTIMAAEAAREFAALQDAQRPRLSDALNRLLDEGRAISQPRYGAALVQRTELQALLASFLAGCDAIVTPPVRGEAPATLEQTGDPAFCTIWTLCGRPALGLPAGFGPRGLPLGLQLVGPDGDDARLLRVAQWVERVIAWSAPMPPVAMERPSASGSP